MLSKATLSSIQWLDRTAQQNEHGELMLKNAQTGAYEVIDLTPGGTPFDFKQFEQYHVTNRTGFLYCTIDWVRDDYDENVVSETHDTRLKRFTIHLSYSGLTHVGVPFAIVEGGKDLLFRGLTDNLDVILEEADGSRAVYALPSHKLHWIAGRRKEALRVKSSRTVMENKLPAPEIPAQYIIDLMKIDKHGLYYRKQLDVAAIQFLFDNKWVEQIPGRPTACRLTTTGLVLCSFLKHCVLVSSQNSSVSSCTAFIGTVTSSTPGEPLGRGHRHC